MKKITSVLAALMLLVSLSGVSFAQTAKPAAKTVTHQTVKTSAHVTKKGTPDKRFKENKKVKKHFKKNGTPDKRYKENKAK